MGRQFAIGSENGTIYLHDLDTGELKLTLTGHKEYVEHLAFSPDGKTVVSGSGDGTIRFWDIHTGEHRLIFTGHTLDTLGVTFSPDGKTSAEQY